MKPSRKLQSAFAVALVLLVGSLAQAESIYITEWMYSGQSAGKEFVEFTNMGSTAVDMTGWSFSDSATGAGAVDLSAFGVLAAGKSAILTEAPAENFRSAWGLSASIPVVGGNTVNLGRSDAIKLYNVSDTLVDQLVYNDEGSGNVKGPRTQNKSGNPATPALLGQNNASGWVLSSVGDAFGSYASAGSLKDVANPGLYVGVPEPSVAKMLMALGIVGLVGLVWNRQKS